MFVCLFQDGRVLCPRPGGDKYPAFGVLHVLPVLGCDEQQRSSRESVQGLTLQQLLHGHPAARPVPQPDAGGLHHDDDVPIL